MLPTLMLITSGLWTRYREVDQHDVRSHQSTARQRVAPVAGNSRDRDVLLAGQDLRQPLAKQPDVRHDDHPDGACIPACE